MFGFGFWLWYWQVHLKKFNEVEICVLPQLNPLCWVLPYTIYIQNQAFSKEWDVLFSELEYFDKIRYGGDMEFFRSALATAPTETSAVA